MTKQNLLLFLGAGFSKSAGCPIQNDFFNVAYEHSTSLSPEEYAGLSAAQNLAKSFKKFGENPTMEDAFCVVDYLYYMRPDAYKLAYNNKEKKISSKESQYGVQQIRDNFLKSLETIFGYNRALNTYDNHSLYYDFFTKLLDFYNIAVVTLNYDLVCESIFNKIKGVKPIYFPVITNDFSFSKIPLLKLHGSINWKETKYDLPSIIPPTWSKRFDKNSKYNRIWNDAERALFYSDKILFIGCSMPSTDPHIHYLLQYGLANLIDDPREKEIHVVKPKWKIEDKNNYCYLKNKEYNVIDIIPHEMGFEKFAEKDFISLINT